MCGRPRRSMCGRPRRSKGDLVCCAAVGCGHVWTTPSKHVWTTPSKQGRSGMLRRGRVRSCVRPTLRGLRTAGPDAIRSLAPKQIYALEWRITLDGFFQAPVRHHATIALTHPSAVATLMGFLRLQTALPGTAAGLRYTSPRTSKAHTIRAVLSACATETSRAGRRSSRLLSQPASAVDLLRECRITAVAPSTSSRRR